MLFFVAAGSLLLVLIGIHNAWDTVTYITLSRNVRLSAAASGQAETDDPPPNGDNGAPETAGEVAASTE